MENSAYAPNPLPPPGLVVFSQAGGLTETLRLQRPFNTQADSKDIQVPFHASSFGLRLIDSYPGLPAHLLHHLQPQFLHPSLDPRNSFGPGAFQPLSSSANKNFPSAFAPPKCLKMDADTMNSSLLDNNNGSDMFSPGHYQRGDSSSPASVSVSPTSTAAKDESCDGAGDDRDGAGTPGSERTECSTPEDARIKRNKKAPKDPNCCPVCGVSIRANDLESHLLQELDRLTKISKNRMRRPSLPHPRTNNHRDDPAAAVDGSLEGRWETYQRIKTNRQGRLRIKNKKRKADDVACPYDNEDETVDVEGYSESFEEYEWAGQRRIRAASLLTGGYTGVGMVAGTRASAAEEEEDLVVDGDDVAVFGRPQYCENDVISSTPSHNENGASERMQESPSSMKEDVDMTKVKEEPSSTENLTKKSDLANQTDGLVVEALKRRIKELENETKAVNGDKFICLICMEHYKKPVISVCCWHVYCEECWLQTLGAKKLCPQCNTITSPSDLRRIFL
ncbi:E3 ubiquitin-protein ligase Rnf220 isoform X2 [Bemisia tabaci]|uniref:E3 ubiquitin-protein ligase Rnf220 isoform X2 n=1 Tax=Bemisia tabaci TaxID=7038 RepID=UPI0008F9C7F3|nr:PREDICTED: E3 ubiquitin-protein ligase Rnf220-like isoform X2 [Bemisia tabaci]